MYMGLSKKIFSIFVASVMAFLMMPIVNDGVVADDRSSQDTYVKGEVLVVTKKDVSEDKVEDLTEEKGGENSRVKDEISVDKDEKLSVVKIDNKDEVKDVAVKLADEKDVVIAQPNYIYHNSETVNGDDLGSIKTSPRQWYLDKVVNADGKVEKEGANVKAAWKLLKNKNNIKTAVIDTGADYKHSDLSNIDKESSVKIENGKVKKFLGDRDSRLHHGTMVTGVFSASGKTKITGVSNNLTNPIIIAAGNGNFTSKDLVSGVKYAMSKKVKVINMSFTGTHNDVLLLNQVKKAYENGILCVAAAGNDGRNHLTCPSDSIYAIGVLSHGMKGSRSKFSSYGYGKDVSAPGESIYTTIYGNRYGDTFKIKVNNNEYEENVNGTSFAAPIVSGIAVLLLSEKPSLTPRQLKNLIYTSGDGKYSLSNGFGKVDAAKAVENLQKGQVAPTSISLNKSSISTYENSSTGVEYAVLPGNTNSSYAKVTSSNSKVAVGYGSGKIVTKKTGTCTLTFSVGNVKTKCKVTVKPKYIAKKTGKPYVYTGKWTNSDALSTEFNVGKGAGWVSSYMDGYKIYLKKGEKVSIYNGIKILYSLLKSPDESSYFVMNIYSPKKKLVRKLIPKSLFINNTNGIKMSYKAKEKGYYYIENVQLNCIPFNYKLVMMTDKTKVKPSAKVKGRTITFKWRKKGNSSKYRVYIYNYKKKFIKKATVKGTSYKYKKARRGAKYYYRVRPMVYTPMGYFYGGYSAYKKVKVRR